MDPVEAKKKLRYLLQCFHNDEGVALSREIRAEALARGDRKVAIDAAFFLGQFHVEKLQYPEAWDALSEALVGRSELYGSDHLLTTQARVWLATVASSLQRPDETRALARRAVAAIPKEVPPDDCLLLVDVLENIAHVESGLKHHSAALDYARRAVELVESIPDAEELDVASACVCLGIREGWANHYDRAAELLERALEIRLRLLGEDNILVGYCHNHLAVLRLSEGKTAEAKILADASIATLEKSLPGSRQTAVSLASRATMYALADDDHEHSVEAFEQAIRMTESTSGPNSPELARELLMLGLVHLGFDKPALAEPLLRRALTIYIPYHRTQVSALFDVLDNFLLAMQKQKKGKELVAVLEPIYDRLKNELLVDANFLGAVVTGIATGYRLAKKDAKAEKLLRRALAIVETSLGPNARQLEPILHNMAVLMDEMGRRAEAKNYRRRADAILAQNN